VRESLDEETAAGELSHRAYRSRTQFYRLFRALIEESPGAMRRRFLLERAAWELGRTPQSVTEIAFSAGYGTLEAFSRAFRKAYRLSPSLYRRMGAAQTNLPAANGFHFCAPCPAPQGASVMDLFDLFSGTDSWHTRRLLEHASTLTDEQLDRSLQGAVKLEPWMNPEKNLRELLERIVFTKEVWTAALGGGEMPPMKAPPAARTPAALMARFEKADAAFNSILRDVQKRSAWDDTFVDALCEPPETFTFGGMFAHVITFNTHRRLTALDALRRLGVAVEGFGCPSEYEASRRGAEEAVTSK
jgi:AraC-like DNA-binding protein/uncharacterized damage-inducible protein DinB